MPSLKAAHLRFERLCGAVMDQNLKCGLRRPGKATTSHVKQQSQISYNAANVKMVLNYLALFFSFFLFFFPFSRAELLTACTMSTCMTKTPESESGKLKLTLYVGISAI